jgi:hypothetical protein
MSRRGAASTSSPETTVLLLFHAMGDRVPKILLDRAVTTHRRIDMHGEQFEVTPRGAGVDQELADLLDETVLKRIIAHL